MSGFEEGDGAESVKRRKLLRRIGGLDHYAESNVVPRVGAVVHRGRGADFQLSVDFGRVVNKKLQGHHVLTFFNVYGKGSISDG
jgi:hypothetical protein